MLLAFDFGLKRIGVAVGQQMTQTATPLPSISAHQGEPDWGVVHALMVQWRPHALVVGIPLAQDGSPLSITQAAQDFAQALEEQCGLPVYRADEQLTTKMARAVLFDRGGYKALKKTAVDSCAAQLILESWFTDPGKPQS